ncbi:uncharacterized protein LOC120358896 isoform X1 [Solenopsis invicta]|uniref:uncharacterized protein LOC120358896 isoform X1 n=1 Tax=Solenopsis invicta TaxID=13686 RepID=UPI00193CD70A|nr:uncharacterized protein LOC120358896 isoform X1 [Solenopsis invicta]
MPTCFLCKETVQSVNSLLTHFTVKHYVNSFTVFKCGENGCVREWSSWNSLRKHLLGSIHNFSLRPTIMNNTYEQPTANTKITEKFVIHENMNIDEIFSLENAISENLLVTPAQFKSLVKNCFDAFVAKLYDSSSIPRNDIQSIIKDTTLFLTSGHISVLQEKVLSQLNALGSNNEIIQDITLMFNTVEDPFHHLSTEYKCKEYFKSCGNYIAPIEYCIGKRRVRKNTGSCIVERMKDVCSYFIPLTQTLQKFFELPNAFTAIIHYINLLRNSDTITNFIQSKLWYDKRKNFEDDAIVFPLFIYYDDWEVNNPLGSHSTCLGGVYYYIPCLPPECVSRLENIFLALLFNTEDRKEFGNKQTFAPLIEELIVLEQVGITVTVNGNQYKIYFVLSLLLGDNLGLHAMCGFVESFRANYTCRFCKIHRNISQTTCLEDDYILRTRESYNVDLASANCSINGIKEECVFHAITSFHVVDNAYVDIMHDVLEGIAHYDMIPITNHFIQIGDFTLSGLNYSLQMFHYGPSIQNKPPSISDDFATKNKFKMTASEMLTFCKLFGVIIGHKVKSYNDPFWKLYLLLKEIIEFIFSKSVSQESASAFKILVEEHHIQYLKCTKQYLKPKHHNLIHYARVMMQCGPLVSLSVIRLEGFHKALKKISNVVMSRQNIAFSIVTRYQFLFCYRLMAKESILPNIQTGSGNIIDISENHHFDNFMLSLPNDINYNACFVTN